MGLKTWYHPASATFLLPLTDLQVREESNYIIQTLQSHEWKAAVVVRPY